MASQSAKETKEQTEHYSSLHGAIDAHCHLEQKGTFFNRDELILSCKAAEMSAVITVCAKPTDLQITINTVKKHKGFVYATAGLHPLEAVSHSENEIDSYLESIKELVKLDSTIIRAIGEVGLDDVLVNDPTKKQISRDVFIQFIEFANELKLPLSIHCREAYPESIKMLSDYGANRVVFHYFNQPKFVDEITEQGWHLSLPVTIAFSKKRFVDMINAIRNKEAFVMVETDSPIELQGKRVITPLDVSVLIDSIAREKKQNVSQIVTETTNVATGFFSLR